MKKITCEYCGEKFNDTAQRCPHCGGPNRLASQAQGESRLTEKDPRQSAKKRGAAKPRTIDELRAFAAAHKLPLDRMRVHLGEDYRGPKAFGIYQAKDGSYVVYKNKADGSRAIRYQGPDEAHAANELYLKMKEMVSQQRSYQSALRSRTGTSAKKAASGLSRLREYTWVILLVAVICFWIWGSIRKSAPTRGYYRYNDEYYYCQGGNWYYYDDGWLPVIADSALTDHYDDYYESTVFNREYGVTDFASSGYYDPNTYENDGNWNDDDDDDWDWGDDDWDDIGDWDSDW